MAGGCAVVTLAVVLACIWVVQLRHGAEAAVDAGCRPTLASARHQATSGPRQLTAVKCNQADSVGLGLGVGPPTSSLRSVRAPAVVESGKRRRKSVDGTTRHLGSRDYRRATGRERKSWGEGAGGRRSQVGSVDELERRLRQYQARRIAEEMARLRAIHAGRHDDEEEDRRHSAGKNRRRHGHAHRRRCSFSCRRRRRRRLRAGGRRATARTTVIAPGPTSPSP